SLLPLSLFIAPPPPAIYPLSLHDALPIFTYRDERGGYFTLMLYPPQELKELGRQALELVFVLDCSGSMSGRPLAQAKAAIERARSEEHTSELQSRENLVCRLLLEKKKKIK